MLEHPGTVILPCAPPTAMPTKDGRRIHIRKSTEPEPFHRLIYDALELSYYPY